MLRLQNNHSQELPPRARRIQQGRVFFDGAIGTTSACAENTLLGCQSRPAHRNYLRVRGEYPAHGFTIMPHKELPPRARRILPLLTPVLYAHGTTSACAENTRVDAVKVRDFGNYLRVRGEYKGHRIKPFTGEELPPRARRIPGSGAPSGHPLGTTSACAENTWGLFWGVN